MEKVYNTSIDTQIGEIRERTPDALYSIIKEAIGSYFKCLKAFGPGSPVTKDNLTIISEYRKILRKEKALFRFILDHKDKISKSAAKELVYDLDHLNDLTIRYYYDTFGDMELAAEMKDERRGTRPNKDFPTLIESNEYDLKAVALLETFETVKAYLNFEDDFWKFMELGYKLRMVDLVDPEGVEVMSFVTPISDGNDNISSVICQIPRVCNLQTAKKAVEMLNIAYIYYKNIGKPVESVKGQFYTDNNFIYGYLDKKKKPC